VGTSATRRLRPVIELAAEGPSTREMPIRPLYKVNRRDRVGESPVSP
jgi:hypothetical protein